MDDDLTWQEAERRAKALANAGYREAARKMQELADKLHWPQYHKQQSRKREGA